MISTKTDVIAALLLCLPAVAHAWHENAPPQAGVSHVQLAAQDDDPPASRDALFATEAASPDAARPDEKEPLPGSKDALFGDDATVGRDQMSVPMRGGAGPDSTGDTFGAASRAHSLPPGESHPWRGFLQTELAYTYGDPAHWSETQGRLMLGTQGHFGTGVQWKASGRFDYNAVHDLSDYYSGSVRHDQQAGFRFGETYMDFTSDGWDWRVGRQHIVWGEMVGLFFADVVSAKDLREYVLPDFQTLRIPQWAARTEYFKDDFHAEVVWIPFPSYDLIGQPFKPGRAGAGSDFYPYPLSPAGMPMIGNEEKPGYGFGHGNFGIRLSRLARGWDLSGFYYTSMDSSPTFLRDPIVQTLFTPVHTRIGQAGGTLAKDFGSFVLKSEAVYTRGREYNVTTLADSDGVVKQNTLDWAVGLDFNPATDTRLNAQLFQRVYFDYDPSIHFDRMENGYSLLVHHDFTPKWQGEILLISSFNRNDWLLRPKLTRQIKPDWHLTIGLDVFDGAPTGMFGQYKNCDRIYTEARYDF